MDKYRAVNLRNWESRVPVHAGSRDYDLAGLAADPSRLSAVVAFDQPWLGDLTGLDVVHLQCHIGTDTVSLAPARRPRHRRRLLTGCVGRRPRARDCLGR